MTQSVQELLRQLTSEIGPSGFESAASAAWRAAAESFADEVATDVGGNSYAWLRVAPEAPTVVLEAHIDEIGLQVLHIDPQGFLWIGGIGGWDAQVLVGQRIRFRGRSGDVTGVVGRKALHLLSPSDREKAVELKQLWVDIGATSREEAQQRVRVGDYGVVDAPFLHLTDDVVSARANDNRAGTVVILEALRLLSERRPAVNVVALAATREEISYAGAFTASVQLAPLAAFVVDVTHATDYPEADKRKDDEVRLGGGPVITRGSSTNPRLTDELIALAERLELPFAIQASPDKSWTDADAMIQAGRGTATAIISIPTRYMHSPNETISLGDLSACAELIAEMTATITPESDFRP